MTDFRIARIAALYRAGTSTEGQWRPPANPTPEEVFRAKLWRATLAKSMDEAKRRRPCPECGTQGRLV
ncbi:MAG: hypothetical protein AB7P40_12330 [Chloroflexota bacterium]